MAEIYSFFDPVETSPDVFDREYNAQEFTDYFASLVTTGVMKGAGAELKVTANGSNMLTEIDTGIAFLEGKRYANTTKLAHTLDTETLGKNRIDRIVVRLDLNTEARHVKSFIKKGVASASPVPPALQRDGGVYEISLAQVKVIGGQTYINSVDVTDERGQDAICPWAGSNILPNFDDEALQDLVVKVDNMFSLTDGPYAKTYTGDLNNLVESGIYFIPKGTANMPTEHSSSDAVVEVIVAKDGNTDFPGTFTQQKIRDLNTHSPKRAYVRRGDYFQGFGQSWSKWLRDPMGKQENWIEAVMTSGTPDITYPIRYYKDDFGVVHVLGQVKGTFVAWYMPVGYRPNYAILSPALLPSSISGYLSVQENGYFVMSSSQDNYHRFNFSYRAKEE